MSIYAQTTKQCEHSFTPMLNLCECTLVGRLKSRLNTYLNSECLQVMCTPLITWV